MNEFLIRLRTAWDNLSAREQILCTVAGVSIGVTLLAFLVVLPFINMGDSAGQRVLTAERQLLAMTRLQREYGEIQSRLATVEERIQNQRGQSSIRTLLETLARESSVKITSMEERKAGKNSHYVENKVEVALKNVTLTQAVKYLSNIEASDQQLSVKNLRIKAKQDRTQLLDVTFSVSSYRAT